MSFCKVFGITDEIGGDKTTYRETVKAVIRKEDKLLMILNNRGDYKFPGGGVNKKESHSHCLKREILEETGYKLKSKNDLFGKIIERKADEFEKGFFFEMKSYYYFCETGKQVGELDLDEYEAELGFRPVWVEPEKALQINTEILKTTLEEINSWVEREVFVLKELIKT